MLTLFSRSEDLYEDDGEVYGLRPLALMLADAAESSSPQERNYALQRIGDIALFISGFFIDSLARKFQVLVDVLNEVRAGGRESPIDILRTYEVWLKTGSRRAEAQLRDNGIVPIADSLGPKRH